jgi:hypothetical protein
LQQPYFASEAYNQLMLARLTRREFALVVFSFGIGLILLFYATEPRRQERRAPACFTGYFKSHA